MRRLDAVGVPTGKTISSAKLSKVRLILEKIPRTLDDALIEAAPAQGSLTVGQEGAVLADLKELSAFLALFGTEIRNYQLGSVRIKERSLNTLGAMIAFARTFIPGKIRRLGSRIETLEPAPSEVAPKLIYLDDWAPRSFVKPLTVSFPSGDVGAGPGGIVGASLEKNLFSDETSRNVPVFFATDRKPYKNPELPRAGFDDGRASPQSLTYGIAEVSIPPGHKLGHVERPTLWKLQWVENPDKHIVIQSCEIRELDLWKQLAAKRLGETASRSALVFVHGFNVSFDEAVRRTAQIGYDIQYKGLITTYSWSSEARTLGYSADEDNVRLTVPLLRDFLFMLRKDLGLDTIHIIAHSMGNRAIVEALTSMNPADGKPCAEEVVMAAPDIAADLFKAAIAGLRGKARRYTLYGSKNDLPMILSKKLHGGYARAGDGGSNIFVADGIDTVDASAVGDDILGLGHSYFSDDKSVLSDIYYVVEDMLPPKKRFGLIPRIKAGLEYWLFKP
jgi:esterase/lipase superfamily enzyme